VDTGFWEDIHRITPVLFTLAAIMPEFASHEYWEARFQNNGSAFDWLVPANTLCDIVRDNIDKTRLPKAEILNVGCGTAESSAFRELVNDPEQVHNVDYSQAAIDAAAAREKNLLQNTSSALEETSSKRDSIQRPPLDSKQPMRWSCLDLLSLNHTLTLLDEQRERGSLFDIVVDKSTSDSIACGSGATIRLPYLLSIEGWTRGILQSGLMQTVDIHSLHVLAVHLAAVTKPRTGKWIVVSYSDERFPFLPPYPKSVSQGFLPETVIKAGFPHPNQLWRLETKEKIDTTGGREETLAQRKKRLSSGAVHRQEVSHWLYVLVRTDASVTD